MTQSQVQKYFHIETSHPWSLLLPVDLSQVLFRLEENPVSKDTFTTAKGPLHVALSHEGWQQSSILTCCCTQTLRHAKPIALLVQPYFKKRQQRAPLSNEDILHVA